MDKRDPTPKVEGCEELVEWIAEQMAFRVKKHALKRKLEAELGETISIKSYEVLRNKAREFLKQRLEAEPNDHLSKSILFYESVICDPMASYEVKVRAQKALEELLGIGARFTKNQDVGQVASRIREALKEFDNDTEPMDET